MIAPTATAADVPFQLIVGEHPQPGPGSLAAGREALRMAIIPERFRSLPRLAKPGDPGALDRELRKVLPAFR